VLLQPEQLPVRRLVVELAPTQSMKNPAFADEVLDKARGKGLGRALIEGCEAWARDMGHKLLTIGVLAQNQAAIRSYGGAGYSPYVGNEIAVALGLKGEQAKQIGKVVKALYDAFLAKDMSLLEINPLVVTKDGDIICLDAKLNFDDNALYRHKDVQVLRDLDEEDPAEVEASKYDLSYIKLDGEIGCMVNGAGLAMATMDIIKLYGSEPANFLDVGGGASKEKVTAAFKIIVRDPNVKGILVNIFGGIMKCDIIAEGIIAAAKEISLSVPLVVRLEGTNVELGKEILARSGLAITSADNLADAAEKIVKAVKGS